MYIQLYHRHYGVHRPIEIPCDFNEIYKDEDNINETLLLKSLPKNYINIIKPNLTLLVVDSTVQCGLKIFRSWGKYYDSDVLYIYSNKPKE